MSNLYEFGDCKRRSAVHAAAHSHRREAQHCGKIYLSYSLLRSQGTDLAGNLIVIL